MGLFYRNLGEITRKLGDSIVRRKHGNFDQHLEASVIERVREILTVHKQKCKQEIERANLINSLLNTYQEHLSNIEPHLLAGDINSLNNAAGESRIAQQLAEKIEAEIKTLFNMTHKLE